MSLHFKLTEVRKIGRVNTFLTASTRYDIFSHAKLFKITMNLQCVFGAKKMGYMARYGSTHN